MQWVRPAKATPAATALSATHKGAPGVCRPHAASCSRLTGQAGRPMHCTRCRLACALLLPYPDRRAPTGAQPNLPRAMLTTEPHILTRAIEGDVTTLVFYPDTGCLRFADSRGVVRHELRPPHSWFAIASASRGVRGGTHAMSEGLSTLLHDFCVKRSHAVRVAPRLPTLAHARAFPSTPGGTRAPVYPPEHTDMHARSPSLTMDITAA